LLVIIALLLLEGFLVWKEYSGRTKSRDIDEELKEISNFLVEYISNEEKLVKSKEGDFEFILLKGLHILKEKEYIIGPLHLVDAELFSLLNKNKGAFETMIDEKQGCFFIIGQIKKNDLNELKAEIQSSMKGIELVSDEVLSFEDFNGYKVLRHEYETLENGYWLDLLLSSSKNTYVLSVACNREDKEYCFGEFYKLVKRVYIQGKKVFIES